MTTTVPTTRPNRMSAEERRDAIVVAAVAEFAAGGLVGASTETIARSAGVSQPYVAVIRRCFGRTKATFEQAAGGYEPGKIEGCNSVLDAIGRTYMRQLDDRTGLLVQLQAYAACADPDVRDVVRDEFTSLHRLVTDLSGASASEIHHFFAEGMLLNVAAAMDFGSRPSKHWLLENLEGDA